MGLPPLALWHLVGVTTGITLDKNGSFKWYVGNWTPSHAIWFETMTYIRFLRWTSRIRWRYSENVKPAIDIVPEIGNSHCRVLGLALRHDCKNTMQIRLKTTPKKISDCDNRVKTQIVSCRGSWLSPSSYENKCRYRNVRPHSLPAESHSFVGMARETAAMPPAL